MCLVLGLQCDFDGRGTAWALLAPLPYGAAGTAVAYWLLDPPLHGIVEIAVAAIDTGCLLAILPFVLPLALQALGALASFVLLIAAIALCRANVVAALMAMRERGAASLAMVVRILGGTLGYRSVHRDLVLRDGGLFGRRRK